MPGSWDDPAVVCPVLPHDAVGAFSLGPSPVITYTTEDANMQIGIILNRWDVDPDSGNAKLLLTIWWNNPFDEIAALAPGIAAWKPENDAIQAIWVYKNAFDVDPQAFAMGEAGIVAYHQPHTTRGAWAFTLSAAEGDWYAIKFEDTFSTTPADVGMPGADSSWVAPLAYDSELQRFVVLKGVLPHLSERSRYWTRLADTSGSAVRYLDPGEYCVSGGLDGLLCNLTAIALVMDAPTQGQQIVLENRATIAAVADAYQVPEISLAAGIANQANAFTRPFDSDFLERCLVRLPDGPFTGAGASVGIAQITKEEMALYLPDCDAECLFDRKKSFEMMAAKLRAANALLPADIDPTEQLMVLALAQNNGAGPAEAYRDNGGNWQLLSEQYGQSGYTWDQGDWDQLGKILKIIVHLLAQGYALPDGVDLNRWQQIYDLKGQ
ncbi:MAG: hypothetical protein ACOYYS_21600 [Chloroflexota bacterium]